MNNSKEGSRVALQVLFIWGGEDSTQEWLELNPQRSALLAGCAIIGACVYRIDCSCVATFINPDSLKATNTPETHVKDMKGAVTVLAHVSLSYKFRHRCSSKLKETRRNKVSQVNKVQNFESRAIRFGGQEAEHSQV